MVSRIFTASIISFLIHPGQVHACAVDLSSLVKSRPLSVFEGKVFTPRWAPFISTNLLARPIHFSAPHIYTEFAADLFILPPQRRWKAIWHNIQYLQTFSMEEIISLIQMLPVKDQEIARVVLIKSVEPKLEQLSLIDMLRVVLRWPELKETLNIEISNPADLVELIDKDSVVLTEVLYKGLVRLKPEAVVLENYEDRVLSLELAFELTKVLVKPSAKKSFIEVLKKNALDSHFSIPLKDSEPRSQSPWSLPVERIAYWISETDITDLKSIQEERTLQIEDTRHLWVNEGSPPNMINIKEWARPEVRSLIEGARNTPWPTRSAIHFVLENARKFYKSKYSKDSLIGSALAVKTPLQLAVFTTLFSEPVGSEEEMPELLSELVPLVSKADAYFLITLAVAMKSEVFERSILPSYYKLNRRTRLDLLKLLASVDNPYAATALRRCLIFDELRSDRIFVFVTKNVTTLEQYRKFQAFENQYFSTPPVGASFKDLKQALGPLK